MDAAYDAWYDCPTEENWASLNTKLYGFQTAKNRNIGSADPLKNACQDEEFMQDQIVYWLEELPKQRVQGKRQEQLSHYITREWTLARIDVLVELDEEDKDFPLHNFRCRENDDPDNRRPFTKASAVDKASYALWSRSLCTAEDEDTVRARRMTAS
jgi:hypothetical protein